MAPTKYKTRPTAVAVPTSGTPMRPNSKPRAAAALLNYRKKIAEGKSRKEALRCLKRRVSDAVFKASWRTRRRLHAALLDKEEPRKTLLGSRVNSVRWAGDDDLGSE